MSTKETLKPYTLKTIKDALRGFGCVFVYHAELRRHEVISKIDRSPAYSDGSSVLEALINALTSNYHDNPSNPTDCEAFQASAGHYGCNRNCPCGR